MVWTPSLKGAARLLLRLSLMPLALKRFPIVSARRCDPGVALWSSVALFLFASACGTPGGGGMRREGGTGDGAGGSADADSTGVAGTTGGGDPLPTVQLLITPSDGTTAWAGGSISLSLYDPAGIASDAWLDEIKAKAFLETWPERAPVAFQEWKRSRNHLRATRLFSCSLRRRSTRGGTSQESTAGCRPRSASTRLWRTGRAVCGSRTDSHPIVRTIQFCTKAGAGMKLLVAFSEPLTLSVAPEKLVTLMVDGASVACTSYY